MEKFNKMGRVVDSAEENLPLRPIFWEGISEAVASPRIPASRKASMNETYYMGRVVGIEPTNTGTTIRGLNHLATPAIILYLIVILLSWNFFFAVTSSISQDRVTTFGDTRH